MKIIILLILVAGPMFSFAADPVKVRIMTYFKNEARDYAYPADTLKRAEHVIPLKNSSFECKLELLPTGPEGELRMVTYGINCASPKLKANVKSSGSCLLDLKMGDVGLSASILDLTNNSANSLWLDDKTDPSQILIIESGCSRKPLSDKKGKEFKDKYLKN